MQPVIADVRNARQMRLTRAIVRWLAVDLGGLLLLMLGGVWLVAGLQPIPSFPSSGGQAWFCVALGFVLMLYAIFEMLKEFLTQRSATPAASTSDGPPR